MKKEVSDYQHQIEIEKNLSYWKSKPLLKLIYSDFYKTIAKHISTNTDGKIVELGSGIGNLKMEIATVITTDVFPNPWIDQQENAYKLSFEDQTVSNLILFDVFHHLKFPGNALQECQRVLKTNGRVIIFEPGVSLLGRIVYGLFHHEPLGLRKNISWLSQAPIDIQGLEYYAAQGNAHRVFLKEKENFELPGLKIIVTKRLSALSYILSGGYSSAQLYPTFLYKSLKKIDALLTLFPAVFSTRMLIVLEKN